MKIACARRRALVTLTTVLLSTSSCTSATHDDGVERSGTSDIMELDTISVPIKNFRRNDGGGRGLSLDVGVGGAAPMPLVIDTGSAGVHVLAADIAGAAVTRTGKKVTETYVDGTQLVGEDATATVQIGGVDTLQAIHVHLVDEVTCAPGREGCSGAAGADFFHAVGISGLVGVGLSNANAEPEIFSPLAQLPGELSNGYVVKTSGYDGTSGTLVIGLTDATRREYKTIDLAYQPLSLPNAMPAWEDAKVNVCYTLEPKGSQPAIQECGLSIIDTGATAFFWNTSQLAPDSVDPSGTLRGGLTMRAQIEGVFDWTFTTTDAPTPGVDMVIWSPGAWNTNLGIGIYFAFDVMSDVRAGKLGFKPRQ